MPYIISVIILVIIGVGFTLFKAAPSTELTEVRQPELIVETNDSEPAPDTASSSTNSHNYRDGNYSGKSNYRTPEGDYQMELAITIESDVITSSKVSFNELGAKSNYSKSFMASYEPEVLQKNIEEVSLSRVGGASLTTRAFNSAVESIKQQAAS